MAKVDYFKCDGCGKTLGKDELDGWIHMFWERGKVWRSYLAGRIYVIAESNSSLNFCSTDCLVTFVSRPRLTVAKKWS